MTESANSLLVLVGDPPHPTDHSEHSNRVHTANKLHHSALLVQHEISILVSVAVATLLFGLEDVEGGRGERVLGGNGSGEGSDGGGGRVVVREDVFGVEKLGVDLGGSEVTLADDEDLGGDVTRGRGLGGLDLGEELVENPEERVVILGTEDLGAEGSAGGEEFGGELERSEYELDLGEGILYPGSSDIGSSIVEYAVFWGEAR